MILLHDRLGRIEVQQKLEKWWPEIERVYLDTAETEMSEYYGSSPAAPIILGHLRRGAADEATVSVAKHWALAAQSVANDLHYVREMRCWAAKHDELVRDVPEASMLHDISDRRKARDFPRDNVSSMSLLRSRRRSSSSPAQQGGRKTTFAYQWRHRTPSPPVSDPADSNEIYRFVAPHGAELDFLWGWPAADDLLTRTSPHYINGADVDIPALSQEFMFYVANFAYTGDVNSGPWHAHVPTTWPEFSGGGLVFGGRDFREGRNNGGDDDAPRAEPGGPRHEQLELWKRVLFDGQTSPKELCSTT